MKDYHVIPPVPIAYGPALYAFTTWIMPDTCGHKIA